MSSEALIEIAGLGKCFHVYDRPGDRLKQMITPKLDRISGRRERRYYREFWALRDISFSIGAGETVGIIGRNGSGKSTLLQIIAGTLQPTTGHVRTRGRIAAILELGAGFNPEFTGRQNAVLNATILGYDQADRADWIERIVDFSELGDFIDQPVKTYSSGMYARLAFAVSINVEPDILIVDEALAVGDSRFVAKCMRRVRELQDRGVTVLFVSHDVATVRTLCKRAIWLRDGGLVEDGDAFTVTGRYVEFLFADETADDVTVSVDAPEEPSPPPPAQTGGEHETPRNVGLKLDKRPVTHWGAHKGMIRSASVCTSQGLRKDQLPWGELIEIRIDVAIPADIAREHLSVAFSIKDPRGTDLIVSTTWDRRTAPLPDNQRFAVKFRFINPLVNGDYLLVAAVEDRRTRDTYYYEYLEGAHYFSSVTAHRFFGVFQPSIEQCVEAQ